MNKEDVSRLQEQAHEQLDAIRAKQAEGVTSLARREFFRAVAALQGEYLDPTPVEITVPDGSVTLRDELRSYIRHILSAKAEQMGMESFSEANDFALEDDEEESIYQQILEAAEEIVREVDDGAKGADAELKSPSLPADAAQPLDPTGEPESGG